LGELQGKIAIITGAGSGMGRAAAHVFAANGAQVLVADISGQEEVTAASIGESACAYRCDVSKEAEVEAMIAAAVERYGRVDAILNVAGFALPGMLDEFDMAQYDRMLDVDLRGVIHGTKHAIRAMVKTGGGVVLNWSSIAGLAASPRWSVYSAAKAGVIAITKSAALEYAAAGIRANVICPGTIETEAMAPVPLERIKDMKSAIPMGRFGSAEEVAQLASFLVSDRAAFINGAMIAIDGGQTCKLP
jgi:NAD(P)-dependent dehydrogenase (short-subunit alcohol dehydrogenase family)